MNALLRRDNCGSKRRAKTLIVKIGSPIAGHPPAEGSQSDAFFRDSPTSKVPISFGMLLFQFDRTSNGSSR